MGQLKEQINLVLQTLLSVVKILLYSRINTKMPRQFKNNDEVVILGNGPSLNKTVEVAENFLKDKSLICVNFFINSELYAKLKPEIYVIADPFFWILEENLQKFFAVLVEKTTWELNLFVPQKALKNAQWKKIVEKNPHIHVCIYNVTPIEGVQPFCNFIFKKRWGVPRPYNVLIPSIVMALNLPFKTIYLAGADHSWLRETTVDDSNNVLVNQKHCYDENSSRAQAVQGKNLTPVKLHVMLFHMYTAFKSYFVVRAYAEKLNKKVYNITPGSFIDAFDRRTV